MAARSEYRRGWHDAVIAGDRPESITLETLDYRDGYADGRAEAREAAREAREEARDE